MAKGNSTGALVMALSVLAFACTDSKESLEFNSEGGGGGGAEQTGIGGKANATSSTAGSTVGGASTSTQQTSNVPACEGIVTTKEAIGTDTETCDGTSEETEADPVDMIILMDKSISNTYAIGTSAAATDVSVPTRWDVLTAGMEALATSTEAADIGASITFFSVDGTEAVNCDPASYETPVVALGPLSETGTAIVEAMQALTPGGLTPTVPALQGAFTYAMTLKADASNNGHEKVVVLISDGYPTQCDQRYPEDVIAMIDAAATASTPIRTFIVGVGDPAKVNSKNYNLINYAEAGQTSSPFLIDETDNADGITSQLVSTLLNISTSTLSCDYDINPPAGTAIDVARVTLTYEPKSGNFQELPRVSGLAGCAASEYGGWYFDDNTNPTKVTVCPCNCAAFGAGIVSLVYGCIPKLDLT